MSTPFPLNSENKNYIDFSMSGPGRYHLYRDIEADINPPYQVLISDIVLNEDTCEYHDMIQKFMEVEGYCTWYHAGCGGGEPHYIGIGHTEDQARWHGVYQLVRQEHWHNGLSFVPSIYQVDPKVIQNKQVTDSNTVSIHHLDQFSEFIYAQHLGTPFNEEGGLWLCEAQLGQFTVHSDYGAAVNEIVQQLPEGW